MSSFHRKRFREGNNKENSRDSLVFCSNDTGPGYAEVLMTDEDSQSLQLNPPYNLAPNCPVSPRVKNIREDMDALIMSRQDNPFISQQLELLSSSSDPETRTVSPITFVTQSSYEGCDDASQSLLTIHDLDDLVQLDQENLHEHMIRSPPPQFPQKISHFVFPGPGSPVSIRNTVQSKDRPPILKAASESAAMSVSLNSKNDPKVDDGNRGRLRRASAGGQMDTAPPPTIETQPTSLMACQAKKFQSMNLSFASSPKRTNHSMLGQDLSTEMDSESQEALLPDLK